MAKKKKKNFKNPHGLKIDRKNKTFLFSWELGQNDYKDQVLNYAWITKKEALTNVKDAIKNGKDISKSVNWKDISVDKNDKNKSVSYDNSDFYPTSGKPVLYGVVFRVRAKSKAGKLKPWVYKAVDIDAPPKPTLNLTWDSNTANKVSFSWSLNGSEVNTKPFVKFEWQSIRGHASDSGKQDYSKENWSEPDRTGSPTAAGSNSITDTDAQSGSDFSRIVRIRSVGPGGASGWVYDAHPYARPYKPGDIIIKSIYQDPETNYFQIAIEWSDNGSLPVDASLVQYVIGVPRYIDGHLYLPDGVTDSSWQTAQSRATPKGYNNHSALIQILAPVPVDNCLWFRIHSVHDTQSNDSNPKLVYSGGLAAPSLTIPEPPSSERLLTLTVNRRCTIPGSHVALYYQDSRPSDAPSNYSGKIVGLIPSEDFEEQNPKTITIKIPDFYKPNDSGTYDISIGAQSFVGTYTSSTRSDDVTFYTISEYKQTKEWGDQLPIVLSSKTTYEDGDIPKAPTNVVASKWPREGVINVRWAPAWKSSNGAQIAWADHDDALYSTSQPSSFDLTSMQGSRLNIDNLELGKNWYIWVRLMRTNSEGNTTYGPYAKAEPFPFPLTQVPVKPVLTSDKTACSKKDMLRLSWVYVSGDTTKQKSAIVQVYNNNAFETFKEVEEEQFISFKVEEIMKYGNEVEFRVIVISESGMRSDPSETVTINIQSPPSCTIVSTSLEQVNKTIGSETKSIYELQKLPLTFGVSGAFVSDILSLEVYRADDYKIYLPDESEDTGYAGETVYQTSLTPQVNQTSNLIGISREDLRKVMKKFDDGGTYIARVSVTDELGQTTSVEREFEVNWTHQAVVPTVTIEPEITEFRDGEDVRRITIMKITPQLPSGVNPTDYAADKVDIYRLSAEKPERIVKDGAFGTTYVDPYPTIGDQGGYRVVMVTADGDSKCADSTDAWDDWEGNIDTKFQLIDFGGREIEFKYNVSLDNSWNKRFTTTKYLGGGTQGDWDAGVDRTGSLKGVTFYDLEPEVYQDLRDLAEHDGICRLRTIDGTNIACNIDVSDNSTYNSLEHKHDITLSYTKVDNYEDDGVTYDEWIVGDNQ